MYKTLIWCASAVICLAACLTIAASAPQSAVVIQPVSVTAAVVTPTEIPQQPEVNVKSEDQIRFEKFENYVLDAMNSAAKPDSYSASYKDVAHDIATVVLDPQEPPIWKNDKMKARTAVLLVSLAYNETSFHAYVDDGRCNDVKWRSTSEGAKTMKIGGNCDGGHARSMWQLHMSGGIVIVPVNYDDESKDVDRREWCYSYQCSEDDGKVVDPKQVIENRQDAIRIALHMVRRSIRNHVGLCQFTGESDVCPKGEVRLQWAEGPKGYSKFHPYSPSESI